MRKTVPPLPPALGAIERMRRRRGEAPPLA